MGHDKCKGWPTGLGFGEGQVVGQIPSNHQNTIRKTQITEKN